MESMQEIIIKKVSVYKTKIEDHLLETIKDFIDKNKINFTAKSWECKNKTSIEHYSNILYQVQEFKYIRKNIEKKIEEVLNLTHGIDKPFVIFESWLNFYEEGGYQEFHKHPQGGSGVLYLSSNNSAIEFAVFPEDIRKKIIPEKLDILLFEGNTFHRVLDSKNNNRMSLAFNFK